MKEKLTDRGLKALANKARDIPYDVMDDQVRSYGVRVRPNGEVIHVLYRRFPGSKKPTRRKLGRYPEMSLSAARDLACDWIAKIRKGIDPGREQDQARQANIEEQRKRQTNTVEAALKSYLLDKSELRSIRKMEVDMRREMKPWLDRPLPDISTQDVKDLINTIKARGHKGQARAAYVLIKGFFTWAVRNCGLNASPCAQEKISTVDLVGHPKEGDRALKDHEIRAFWNASTRLGYPNGPFFKMLLLSPRRRCEASDAPWSEFDRDKKQWIIVSSRLKSKPGRPAPPHLVAITPAIRGS